MRSFFYAVLILIVSCASVNAETSSVRIQNLIIELGGNIGVVDGKIGEKTRSAATEILGFDVSGIENNTLLLLLAKAHKERFPNGNVAYRCYTNTNNKVVCSSVNNTKSAISEVAVKESTCANDPKKCEDKVLCTYATTSTGSQYLWSYFVEYKKYVQEAKVRGLNCPSLLNLALEGKATAQKCDQNVDKCSDAELCEVATYETSSRNWKGGTSEIFVEEAKSRNLTCNVVVKNQTMIASATQCNDSIGNLKNQLSAANSALASQKKSCDGDISQLQANLSSNFVDREAYVAKVDEVAALNAAIADLKESKDSGTVPRDVHDSQTQQLTAANQALADLNLKISSEYVSSGEYDQKISEIEALNAAIADLKESKDSGTVPRDVYDSQTQQLAAANQALAELNLKISSEYVSSGEYDQKLSEIEALNNSLVDLQTKLTNDYIESSIYYREVSELSAQVSALNSSLTEQKKLCEAELTSQVSALNAAIVDSQSRSEIVKRRLSECQTALQSFTVDCKANVECASVMGMQD